MKWAIINSGPSHSKLFSDNYKPKWQGKYGVILSKMDFLYFPKQISELESQNA